MTKIPSCQPEPAETAAEKVALRRMRHWQRSETLERVAHSLAFSKMRHDHPFHRSISGLVVVAPAGMCWSKGMVVVEGLAFQRCLVGIAVSSSTLHLDAVSCSESR